MSERFLWFSIKKRCEVIKTKATKARKIQRYNKIKHVFSLYSVSLTDFFYIKG